MKNTEGFYKNKNVLVAGGTGTIGIALVKLLLSRGANVSVATMDSILYVATILPTGCKYYRGDLCDKDFCKSILYDIDYVFDMSGAKGSILTNEGQYSKMFVSALYLQTTLMHESFKAGIKRYLYPGSICSYPKMATEKFEDDMWNSLPEQNDKYVGVAKRIGEMQARAYLEDGVWDGVRIIRPSNVYGPYDDFNTQTAQVIPALIARCVAGENPVVVKGNVNTIRDFVYVEDVAYWSAEILEKAPPSYPINIGSGKPASIKDVCNIISKIFNVPFQFSDDAYSGDPIRILSTKRAIETIDYKQITTLEDGIKKTVEWYLKNKDVVKLKEKFYAGQ